MEIRSFGEATQGRHPGQQAARIVLATGLILLGFWTLRGFLPALAWAGVFAIALWPLYARARRRWPPGRHNVLVPGCFTLGVALVFVVPVALIAVQISREIHPILDWARDAQANGIPVPDAVQHLPFGSSMVADWWRDNLGTREGSTELLRRFNRGETVAFSRHIGGMLVHRIVLFGFTLLTLFFLFRDGLGLTEQMRRVSRRAFGPSGERVAEQIIASIHGTVDGLVLVGLGEGFLLGVAYAITGVPHPTIGGALSAVAAIVPFGAPVAVGIASLLLVARGATAAAIALFAFGLVLAFCADHFVRPVLIGGATRLPFLWVLLGILGGLEVWGLLGLFLGPAIMSALILLWREWASPA
ncbi:MAG: AI-2E family transporter [Acidisphaera sp.]|nr:AI-2E family transporter [Acidisphaera sp.]